MPLDKKIEQALEEAVKKYNQQESLTKKLIAWVNAIIDGRDEELHASVVFDVTSPLEDDLVE